MASNYPGSLDSFDTIASDKKTSDSVGGRTHRQMHNDLGDAIESVQTELGTNPSGSDATVAARLSAIEAGTNLATGAVTSAKIADDTITADKIAANAVGASELADNAVDTNAIANDAVTAAKIAADAVGSSEIAAGAVGTSELADAAVTSAKIADGTITATDVAAETFVAFTTIGNLLTLNQASCGDALGSTAGLNAWYGSIAYANGGIELTTSAAWGSVYVTHTAVTVSETYTAVVTVDEVLAGAPSFALHLYFRDSGGAEIGSAAISPSRTTAGTLTVTRVAPAGAVDAYWSLMTAGASGDKIRITQSSLHKGAAGVWSLPGYPVVGQSRIAVNNAVDLSGTGSPEGVVTAAPGSTWLQTDATTDVKGWLRWIKATGTGNTGWVAGPEADTGWRDVSASLTNGWTGTLHVRRVGGVVEVLAHALSAASATSGVVYTLPAGFRPGANASSIRGIWYKTDLTMRRINIDTAGQITVTDYAAGDTLYGSESGFAQLSTGWPSSLPGSAWP